MWHLFFPPLGFLSVATSRACHILSHETGVTSVASLPVSARPCCGTDELLKVQHFPPFSHGNEEP